MMMAGVTRVRDLLYRGMWLESRQMGPRSGAGSSERRTWTAWMRMRGAREDRPIKPERKPCREAPHLVRQRKAQRFGTARLPRSRLWSGTVPMEDEEGDRGIILGEGVVGGRG